MSRLLYWIGAIVGYRRRKRLPLKKAEYHGTILMVDPVYATDTSPETTLHLHGFVARNSLSTSSSTKSRRTSGVGRSNELRRTG